MGALSSADAGSFAAKLMESGKQTFGGIELERADVEIEFVSKEGFAAAGDRGGVVVLETTLDDELREKGLVRELVSVIQAMRKTADLDFVARILVSIHGGDRIRRVVDANKDAVASEVLAVDVATSAEALAGWTYESSKIEGEDVGIAIRLA